MLRGRKRRIVADEVSDSASVNSRTVQLLLPENLDSGDADMSGEENLFGVATPSQEDGYAEFPPQPPESLCEHASFLDEASNRNLLGGQANVQVQDAVGTQSDVPDLQQRSRQSDSYPGYYGSY